MRFLFLSITILLSASHVSAINLGPSPTGSSIEDQGPKDNSHILQNQSWDREGGEDIYTATVINSIPFEDYGSTCDNLDDYDAACPFSGSTSPDVVYSYTAPMQLVLSVDLCFSSYDTKVYIMDSDLNVLACNDDYYTGPPCGHYVSNIPLFPVESGITYYFVVDGYGGDCGNFELEVYEYPCTLCEIFCDGHDEGEPPLVDDYVDNFNGGCNTEGATHFQDLVADPNGALEFCGIGGWYQASDGSNIRDTDWFTAIIGETGIVEWTVDAESEVNFLELDPHDCQDVEVIQMATAGPCFLNSMTITGEPGSVIWLWVGSTDYIQPPEAPENEFVYISQFEGLSGGSVSVTNTSWDAFKSFFVSLENK